MISKMYRCEIPLMLRSFICIAMCVLVGGLVPPVQGQVPNEGETVQPSVMEVLRRHCVRCHGEELAESDFRVDRLTSDFADRANAAAWIEARDRINLGEMPPPEEAKMSIAEIETTSKWIAKNLRAAERTNYRGDSGVVMRRMNRHEYTHTIEDLLAMKFPSGESPLDMLPPDGTAEGFDKVGSALLLDPSLMTQYYEVARRIADRAIVDGPPEYPTEKMRLEFEDISTSGAIRYLLERRGMQLVEGGIQLAEGSTRSYGMLRYPGRRDNNVAPTSGFYRFTLRVGGAKGEDGQRPRIRLMHSHPDESMEEIMKVEVEAPWDRPAEYSVVIPRDELGNELSVELLNAESLYMSQRPGENFMRRNEELGKQGDFAETLRLDGRKIAEGWGGDRSTPDPEKLDLTKYPRVFLDYLEVEGPLYDQWPPKSHTMLLGDNEKEFEEENDQLAYAREIFQRFLPRAWRRPVEDDELAPVMSVVKNELVNGESFHGAIRVGLTAVLTSPKFLYIADPTVATDANRDQRERADQFALASRVSYFLWSSMPDEALLALARTGQLSDASELRRQVDRMLDDPKRARFVEQFARQWLQTDRFLAFTPDKYMYREFDAELGEAAVREPLEFFRVVLEHDRSVLNFLDSDFLIINERLAQHYGIEGVAGEDFREVPVPEQSPRGGLLGMTGIHLAGSDGIRTKPVSRAVYVREVLFNDPPDPPPPNAGEVEPNIQGERLTVRERLIQHQQIEACAACHRSLDPYGLALENFNVIGQWRDRQDGENFRGRDLPEIDASGRLPGGQDFTGFVEYRSRLVEQSDRFRRALAEKVLIYAFGRPVQPTDDAMLNQAVEDMKSNGDSLRSLIHSLVTSKAFQK